jgi:hypothetical protein
MPSFTSKHIITTQQYYVQQQRLTQFKVVIMRMCMDMCITDLLNDFANKLLLVVLECMRATNC